MALCLPDMYLVLFDKKAVRRPLSQDLKEIRRPEVSYVLHEPSYYLRYLYRLDRGRRNISRKAERAWRLPSIWDGCTRQKLKYIIYVPPHS